MMHRLATAAALVIALAAAGCPDTGEPQTTGVVQETNLPCDATSCACDREFVYYDEVVRACDGLLARISVCSDVEVCQAVLDSLSEQVTACSDPESPFPVDTSACE
jgi:hypothetical protein